MTVARAVRLRTRVVLAMIPAVHSGWNVHGRETDPPQARLGRACCDRPAPRSSRRLETDRHGSHHRAGRARRHGRPDGAAGRAAPASRMGSVHRGGEQVGRRRHHRDGGFRAAETRRPHHH